MISRIPIKPENLPGLIGKTIGTSEWVEVSQERISQFADVTLDHQFIHIDEEAASKTVFGGTIAHGFLTLSLLSRFAADTGLVLEGIQMGINYGFEKVRFLHPVRAGKRIRGHFTLQEASEKSAGRWRLIYQVTVEIEGVETLALAAEWVTMQVIA